MKLEMKKIVLVFVAGIFALSGVFGQVGLDQPDIKERGTQAGAAGMPNFKYIKIVNETKGYAVDFMLNKGTGAESLRNIEESKEGKLTLKEGTAIKTIHLIIQNKTNKMDMIKQIDTKDIVVAGIEGLRIKINEELRLSNQLYAEVKAEGDTLVITIAGG